MKMPGFKVRVTMLLSTALLGYIAYLVWLTWSFKVIEVPISIRMKRDFSGNTIAILPLGEVAEKELKDLVGLFKEVYKLEVEILPAEKIPPHTFLKERNQYDGTEINQFLRKKRKPHHFRLLGILDKDLTIKAYNYLFGVASINNYVATISTTRLKEEYYGRPSNPDLLRNRLFKIVLHEYGHTFALMHCTGGGNCLMQFIHDIKELDNLPCRFCLPCSGQVQLEGT